MAKQTEAARRQRRNFLKAAGAAAVTLVTTKGSFGQGAPAPAPAKDALQPARRYTEPIDRGLWITWYDLPPEGRDFYLSWLHGTYIPDILKRPGYLWAAHYATRETQRPANATPLQHTNDPKVGTGYHFILIIAAKDTLLFGNPVPSAFNASLPETSQRMLAMRMGERVNIMTEACRCDGQANATNKGRIIASACIQLGSFNCPVEYEEEMHGGYVQQRMPAHCDAASCIRVRKLNSVAGWAKHGILYEYASLEGFNKDYETANAKSPLGLRGHSVVSMLVHAPNGPNLGVRIWPPIPKA